MNEKHKEAIQLISYLLDVMNCYDSGTPLFEAAQSEAAEYLDQYVEYTEEDGNVVLKSSVEDQPESVFPEDQNPRDHESYTSLDTFNAAMIAEGTEQPESIEQYYAAWQILVDTGYAWTLQGWFGRTATSLLENNLIQPGSRREYLLKRGVQS